MLRGFNAELKRVALFTTLCIGFGFADGYVLPTLLVGGTLYMFWMLWQIRQLDIWLNQRKKTPPPEASGIWSDIFESIYRLQKRHEKESDRVRQVLNRVQERTGARMYTRWRRQAVLPSGRGVFLCMRMCICMRAYLCPT